MSKDERMAYLAQRDGLRASGLPEGASHASEKVAILKTAPRGNDGHPLAPNGKRSNLTEDQWATVRTKNFRRWFGDWVAVETKRLLTTMRPFQVAKKLTVIEGVEPLKVAARKHFKEVLMTGKAPVTIDGRKIEFTMTGFKEMARHSADSRVMQIVPSLPQLIESALPIFSEKNHDASKPNIKEYHHYALRSTLGDGDFFVRLVARETNDGHVHYDADATSVEALKEDGEVLSTQPDRKPKPGEDVAHLAKNRLAQWWNSVNPKNVSKIVDENGEPRVVYHGTPYGDFEVFDTKSSPAWYPTAVEGAGSLSCHCPPCQSVSYQELCETAEFPKINSVSLPSSPLPTLLLILPTLLFTLPTLLFTLLALLLILSPFNFSLPPFNFSLPSFLFPIVQIGTKSGCKTAN